MNIEEDMFSKNKALLYIHKNGITFYVDNESAGLQFDYPEEAVKGYELINGDKLKASLASFLKDTYADETYKSIILLSEEVVLEKSILTKSPEDQKAEMQKFLDEAPFKNIGKLLYKMSGIMQVIATNADIYQAIMDILSQYGWEIEAVVPVRIFGAFAANNILSEEDRNSIISKNSLLKEGNLLSDSEVSPKIESKTTEEQHPFVEHGNFNRQNRNSDKKSFLKTIFLGLLIAVAFFIVGFAILQTKPWKSVPFLAKPTPTPTAVPTPTLAPTPIPLTKDKLNVEVLNGTGKVGQAGQVKTLLLSLGYKNVTTDNASTQSNTTTTVSIDNKVDKATSDELVKSLQGIFTDVSLSSNSSSGSNDIVITTGTGK